MGKRGGSDINRGTSSSFGECECPVRRHEAWGKAARSDLETPHRLWSTGRRRWSSGLPEERLRPVEEVRHLVVLQVLHHKEGKKQAKSVGRTLSKP